MKNQKPSILKLLQNNISLVFIIVVSIVIVSWFLFKKSNPKNPSELSHFSSTHENLPELKNQVSLYQSKIQAYKEAKKRKAKKNQKDPLELFEDSFPIEPPLDPLQKPSRELPQQIPAKSQKQINPQPTSIAKTKKKSPSTFQKPFTLEPEKKDKSLEKEKRRKAIENFHLQQKNKSSQKEVILAQIKQTQRISHGEEIGFQLLEDLVVDQFSIPAYNTIYGKAVFSSHRILVEFNSIVYQNQIIPFTRTLFDFDGFKGIAIDSNQEIQIKTEGLQQEILNIEDPLPSMKEKDNYISKGLHSMKKIFTPKQRKIKVELLAGHRVLLKKEKTKL